MHADGSATVKAGTSAHGQGHATAYSQLVSGELGIPIEKIRFVQSDTALVPRGGGTGGSRSLQLGGSAVLERVAARCSNGPADLAAELLEAAPEDIVLSDDGTLGVAGVPSKSVTWAEVSTKARRATACRSSSEHDFVQTGCVVPVRRARVGRRGRHRDRPGRARSATSRSTTAAASSTRCSSTVRCTAAWRPGSRRRCGSRWSTTTTATRSRRRSPSTPSRARPSSRSFEVAHTETPSPLNPLGAKGIGESATVGSTPAVQNAVVDALSHLGVRHIDMPCSPERVWRTIEDARAGTLPDPWREPPAAFATLPLRQQAPRSKDEEIDL